MTIILLSFHKSVGIGGDNNGGKLPDNSRKFRKHRDFSPERQKTWNNNRDYLKIYIFKK